MPQDPMVKLESQVSLESKDPRSNNYGITLIIAIPALLGVGLFLYKKRNYKLS